MGFDALVYCNCFKEGKTKPFPLPELIEYFRFDSDMHLSLDLPWEDATEEAHGIVGQWILSNPCEHNELMYCDVHLANNKGYWTFQRRLEQIGWEQFPTLHAVLPKANGGYALAKDAQLALAELDHFSQLTELGTDVELLAVETGEVIWSSSGIWSMQFDKNGVGMNIGIDNQGFFIAPSKGEKAKRQPDIYKKALDISNIKQSNNQTDTLFRAWRFEQNVLIPLPEPKVEYHNLDTDQRFISECTIQLTMLSSGGDVSDKRFQYPKNLIVQEYTIRQSHFSYIVEPLMKVFKASIETGNPVVWT